TLLVTEGRGARDHFQIWQTRQPVDDALRDSVAQVFRVWITTGIRKRQYHDRIDAGVGTASQIQDCCRKDCNHERESYPINLGRRDQREDASGIVAAVRDSVSRFIRLRSAQSSAACWQRTSRSFSSALLMTSSTLGGRSGFNLVAGAGARLRIDSKITPEVAPRNGGMPGAISYKTTPKENRSVRASSSFPLTCSGDMYATVPSTLPGLVICSSTSIVGLSAA